MSEQIVPGLLAFHPMGALVGQECVRITAGQFCSMIFSAQYRLPSYYRWLLYDADSRPAYRYHRMFLQHLQSGVPGGPMSWLLKSPAHLWQLDALVAEYPDALIVQTHRDPLNVISSISALTAPSSRDWHRTNSSITECAAQSCEEIVVGLQRGMKLRDSGALAGRSTSSTCSSPISSADPFATIRAVVHRTRSANSTPWPSSNMRDTWPHIPATVAAAAIRGLTPVSTPAPYASRCAGISSVSACPTNLSSEAPQPP